MKKLVFILFLFFTINGVSGCSVYQKAKDKTLSFVGLGGNPKELKKKKAVKPVSEVAEEDTPVFEAPAEPAIPTNPEIAPEVATEVPMPQLPTQVAEDQAIDESHDLGVHEMKEKAIAPITPTIFLAGKPNGIFSDSNFVYVAGDNKLDVYDKDFNFKSSILLEGKALSLLTSAAGLLFVSVDNHSLQIFSNNGDGTYQAIKNFEVAGSCRLQQVLGNTRLIVFFPDRVQLLDLSSSVETDIPVLMEWPEKVDDAYLTADNLYLSVGGSIKIIRLSDFSVLSKYSIGTSFKIAGVEGSSLLVLPFDSKTSKTSKTSSIQLLTLNATGGISRAGGVINLATALKRVVGLYDTKIFYTDEADGLHVYNYIDSRIDDALLPPLAAGSFVLDEGNLLAAFPGEYTRYQIELPAPSNPSAGLVKLESKPYVKMKSFSFPQTIESVLLAGPGKAALVASQFYLLPNGLTGAPVYTPIQSGAFKPKLIHLTMNGYVFFDELTGKLAAVKMDLSGLTFFDMASQNIRGFDTARVNAADRLVYAVAAKDGRGENNLFWARLENGKSVRVETKTKISEAGGLRVYAGGTRVIMAGGTEGVLGFELVDKPKAIKKIGVIVSRIPGAKAVDVLVDLNEKWALVYHESANGNFISVVNLGDNGLSEGAIIGDLTLSSRQFSGASFADGGNTVIFPHEGGVAFYDFTNPFKPQKIFNWDTGPALFVDVTNKGKTICAALGSSGLICGDR